MLKKMQQQSNVNEINQEQINNKFNEMCKKLKSIPSIGLSYVEYMAALIYVMYENRQNFRKMLDIKIEDTVEIMHDIDRQLDEFAKKERSKKLFKNIKFSRIMNKENRIIIKNVIIELGQLIDNIETI